MGGTAACGFADRTALEFRARVVPRSRKRQDGYSSEYISFVAWSPSRSMSPTLNCFSSAAFCPPLYVGKNAGSIAVTLPSAQPTLPRLLCRPWKFGSVLSLLTLPVVG